MPQRLKWGGIGRNTATVTCCNCETEIVSCQHVGNQYGQCLKAQGWSRTGGKNWWCTKKKCGGDMKPGVESPEDIDFWRNLVCKCKEKNLTPDVLRWLDDSPKSSNESVASVTPPPPSGLPGSAGQPASRMPTSSAPPPASNQHVALAPQPLPPGPLSSAGQPAHSMPTPSAPPPDLHVVIERLSSLEIKVEAVKMSIDQLIKTISPISQQASTMGYWQ